MLKATPYRVGCFEGWFGQHAKDFESEPEKAFPTFERNWAGLSEDKEVSYLDPGTLHCLV